MPKHDLSLRHLQRETTDFCKLRFASITSKRMLEDFRPNLFFTTATL